MYDITLILPTYKRPDMCNRALRSVFDQYTSLTAEVFLYGDNCPDWDKIEVPKRDGWAVHAVNLPAPNRGNPAEAINLAIKQASGTMTLFLGDDDWLKPNHFNNYWRMITGDYDWAYFNSWVYQGPGAMWVRHSELSYGKVGHSELAIRTKLLKKLPPHPTNYGHDYWLVDELLKSSKRYKHFDLPSYIVNLDPNRFKVYYP